LSRVRCDGSGEAKKKLVLIGKGLTFDSGGYNLKAGAGSMIELMKFDMGGAGAVLGAAKALGHLKPAGQCSGGATQAMQDRWAGLMGHVVRQGWRFTSSSPPART
jgi:leucyl aminopeptidase